MLYVVGALQSTLKKSVKAHEVYNALTACLWCCAGLITANAGCIVAAQQSRGPYPHPLVRAWAG